MVVLLTNSIYLFIVIIFELPYVFLIGVLLLVRTLSFEFFKIYCIWAYFRYVEAICNILVSYVLKED